MLAAYSDTYGPEHTYTGWAHNNLGMTELRLGNLPAAREHMERSVGIVSAAEGADYPHLANPLRNLAWILGEEGRSDEAIPHAERALALAEGFYGGDNPNLRGWLFELGAAHLGAGNVERAAELFRRDLELPATDWETHDTYRLPAALSLARALVVAGDAPAAEKLLAATREAATPEGGERIDRELAAIADGDVTRRAAR